MPINTSDAASTTEGPGTIPDPSGIRRPTILVVDDRPINRDFLVSLLTHFGYQMREAESAEQAWGMAVSGGLDLIITDVHMNGMDGFALLEKLAADPATSEIPAIVYTAAYKHMEMERFARGRQPYVLLTKPSAPEAIVNSVQSLLGSRGALVPSTPKGPGPGDSYRAAALVEVIQDLAEVRSPSHLLQTFCDSSKGLLQAQESFVCMLSSGEGKPPRTFCSQTPSSQAPVSLDDSRLSPTLTRIITAHATGQFRHANPREYGIPLGEGTVSSLLCVPVYTAAHDYGCLCLVAKVGADDFSDDDERLARTLTSHLAILYENATFYEEIQDLAAKLAQELEGRKRSEEELDRSRKEQTRLKDEFLSHVSHELRSPLMVVQQFLEILLEGVAGEINGQQRENLNVALQNTNQLEVMIGDLLETTRIETGKLRVDLRSMLLLQVLDEAVASAQPLAKQKYIAVVLEVPVRLPPVIADRARVRQILTNLLDNAIKFTPEDGKITVRVALDQEDSSFVRIQVRDTGCGMNPDETPKVFDRLYQVPNADCAARKGLGLGLCICKQLVTLHGGLIQAESQPGAGSIFSFTLPVFSVANLIAPILGDDLVPVSVVLVTIELGHNALSSSEVLASLRETVEKCVLPGLDVVMPDSYTTRNGVMFILLAKADERGARVLTRRLEDQLKRNPHVASGPSSPLVRFSTVDLSAAREQLSFGEQQAAAAAQVEENLKAIIADRC